MNITKDFPKERYNTYAKSCNSNLYTKYPALQTIYVKSTWIQ